MSRQRVVVLAGGLSHERDVSLRSGRRVAEALTTAGVETSVRDVDAGLIGWLQRERPDCVIPLLHGETGEDGALREILELVGVPYVGSPPAAARMAFDKPIAKQGVTGAGVLTPASFALPADMFREIGAAAVMETLISRLGLPLVVKPAQGGSALGVSVVRRPEELPGAMVSCFSYGPVALLEQCVTGSRWPSPFSTTRPALGDCPESRSAPTAACTTTRPGTPRARRSSSYLLAST